MARAHASGDPGRIRLPEPLHRLINTDGQRHPKENALAFGSLGLAIVSLVSAAIPDWHVLGTWTGLVGALMGGFDQFISQTRGERWIIVVGLIGSALGLVLNLANGGFG
ncbi:MAG: hypothetical protein GEU96_07200 [Propionibacteriales bacterium]|nr:hypothetical protein [Propionibacteriales bacterium]